MKSNLRFGFTLGEFCILPLQGKVEGPDSDSHIQPKAADVLLCLAEADGEVVEREELLREVWGNSDNHGDALTHCVSDLRHALNDDADSPIFIETVPKRGYRLMLEVIPLRPGVVSKTETAGQNALEVLWTELKHRNVIRVALAYAAVSWLMLQFAEVVFGILDIPEWALGAFLFVLAVGFLIAVIVAWLFQVVPEHEEEFDQRRSFKNAVDIGIIVVLAAALGLLAYGQIIKPPPPPPLTTFPTVATLPEAMTAPELTPRSVAVLRFANFGGDSVFSNGLSEHLLNLLARTGEMRVPSRQVTWMLSDQQFDPQTIARTLRVRYVLEGSVQQSEQRIRVTAQLIDGESGDHVWSESYDETLSADNFFRIQDAIASAVVDKLEATVGIENAPANPGTSNDEALHHYLAGREALNQPKTSESIAFAEAEFQAAISLDPQYAAGYAGMCETQLAAYVSFRNTDYFDTGEAACMRALRIDSDLGEVYAALGSLHRYAGQYDDAEEELLQARELLNDPAHVLEELGRTYRAQNQLVLAEQTFEEAIAAEPENWSVYKSMGNFLFRTGRFEDALPYYKQVTLMQRDSTAAFTNVGSAFYMLGEFANASVAWAHSLELEPTHFAYMNLGNSWYYEGRYGESIEMYRNAIDLVPDDARAWGSLAASCQYLPEESQCAIDANARAIELLETTLNINPLDANALARLGAYLARSGNIDEAQQILNRLADIGWDDPNVPFFAAHAHIEMGESDAALSQLTQAVIMGYPRVLIASDPGFSELQDDPAFRELADNQLN